jgi:hypothetical protein
LYCCRACQRAIQGIFGDAADFAAPESHARTAATAPPRPINAGKRDGRLCRLEGRYVARRLDQHLKRDAMQVFVMGPDAAGATSALLGALYVIAG